MTREELLELIKKGEAVLLNSEGKDVTKQLENPEEKEELLTMKLGSKQLKKLLDNSGKKSEKDKEEGKPV